MYQDDCVQGKKDMKNLSIILIGILLGIWFFMSKGTFLIILLTGLVLAMVISRIKEKKEREIILIISLAAIILRLAFSAANYYSFLSTGKGVDFMPDARAYSASGQYIAEALTNSHIEPDDGNEPAWVDHLRHTYRGDVPPLEYRVDTYARYVGVIYSVFGYSPMAVKFMNSALSLFTALLVFFLARKMFSFKTAAIAFSLYVFMPSVFLWSVTGMKDPLIFFLVTSAIYIYLVHIKERINLVEFPFLAIAILIPNIWISILAAGVLISSKITRESAGFKTKLKDIIPFLIFVFILKASFSWIKLLGVHLFISLAIAFLLSVVSFLKRKTSIWLLIITVCLGLLYPFYSNENINIKKGFEYLSRQAISQHLTKTYSADSSYDIYPEKYYENPGLNISLPEFIVSYVRGIIFALFTPYPFRAAGNVFIMFASIQMLFIYLLIPFILSGILISLRYKWRETILILFFMLNIASIFAVCEGNIGTVFRHRDILTAFSMIFGAIGICNWLGLLDEYGERKDIE